MSTLTPSGFRVCGTWLPRKDQLSAAKKSVRTKLPTLSRLSAPRPVCRRNDVLVYTAPPMPSDIWIAGQIRANLLVSSDAKDTDLVARLVHVWPDERATNIQEGALRLRYRNGFVNPELLEPGSPVRAVVHMRSVAYRLPKGHRLRLHVTSSSFPRLQRNLNTGGDNAAEQQMVTATNTVHYDIDGGSWLELPMLPRP